MGHIKAVMRPIMTSPLSPLHHAPASRAGPLGVCVDIRLRPLIHALASLAWLVFHATVRSVATSRYLKRERPWAPTRLSITSSTSRTTAASLVHHYQLMGELVKVVERKDWHRVQGLQLGPRAEGCGADPNVYVPRPSKLKSFK